MLSKNTHALADGYKNQKRCKTTWNRRCFPSRYENRPPAIREALRIISTDEQILLSRSGLAVMQALIASGVSVEDPAQPIYTRKSTLARMADVAVRSVYRALHQFESLGLIVRHEQSRNHEGCLDIAQIALSHTLIRKLKLSRTDNEHQISLTTRNKEELIDSENTNRNSANLLSLTTNNNQSRVDTTYPEEQEGRAHQSQKTSPVRPTLAHGLAHGTVYKEQIIEPKITVKNQSHAPTTASGKQTQSDFVRYQGRSVARELFWLIEEKRLSLSALFLLQKEASAIGQRLSDFVALRSQRLMQLASKADCFRYLRHLIHQGMDASYMVKQQAEKEYKSAKKARYEKNRAEQVIALTDNFNGKFLVNPKTGQRVLIHARTGIGSLYGQNGPLNVSVKLTSAEISSILAGRWEEWKSSVATPISASLTSILGKRFRKCIPVT